MANGMESCYRAVWDRFLASLGTHQSIVPFILFLSNYNSLRCFIGGVGSEERAGARGKVGCL